MCGAALGETVESGTLVGERQGVVSFSALRRTKRTHGTRRDFPLSPSADPVAVAPAARPRQQQLAVVSLRLEGFHAKESGEKLISAAEQAGSADYYRSAGAADLPFENRSFEIEDVPAALKEIRRVLPSLGNPCYIDCASLRRSRAVR